VRTGTRSIAVLAVGLAAATALVLYLGRENRSEALIRGREFAVAVNDSPPWHMIRDARVVGPVRDLIEEAAERRGIRIRWIAVQGGPEEAFALPEVDIWPLLGKLDSRKGQIGVTDSWVQFSYWLVSRKHDALNDFRSAAGRLIAHRGTKITSTLIATKLPRALERAVGSHIDAVRAVCEGTAAGALISESILTGRSGREARECLDRGVVLHSIPVMELGYGIGFRQGKPEAEIAAAVLLDEIRRMSRDGSLTAAMLRWGVGSGEFLALQTAAQARWRANLLALMTALLGAALLVVSWSLWRLLKAHRTLRNTSRALEDSQAALRQELEQRRKAEERLSYQAQLLAQASDAIIGVDPDWKITFWNAAAETLLGYESHEALQQNADDLEPFRGNPLYVRLVKAVEKDGTWEGEASLRRRDGARVPVQIAATALRSNGARSGAVLGVRDVTRLKRLEDQYHAAQKLESLGRLAGGVAHDFNNLLTVISGYSQLTLSQVGEANAVGRNLAQIAKAADRAAELTGQLLAFSRRQRWQPKVISLNATVREAGLMLKRVLGDNIRLETKLRDVVGCVLADPLQIQQVVINLAVNARDAMPHGGLLRIETLESETAGFAELLVSDSGEGMSEAVQQHIFEPFFTTKPKGKGTGLGLATVYGIVKQSGGEIEVESEEGRGTTFKVLLPLTDEQQIQDPPPTRKEVARGSERILVTEDSPEVRRLTSETLRSFGYDVLEASNGEEAIRVLLEQGTSIRLLLTDCVMPGISGVELGEQVKRDWPDIRIMYMSGYTATEQMPGGGKEWEFLQKPFTPESLASRVRMVLDQRHEAHGRAGAA